MTRKRRKLSRNKRREIRRHKIYILPNLITSFSLFAGFFSIISAIEEHFFTASGAILIASMFDGLDGKIARATKSTSHFGLEYDSLSDLIAFGVAPSILMFIWALKPFGRLGWLISFLFVACGALRLARFNTQINIIGDTHNYFIGLPIPAAASMIATTVIFIEEVGPGGPIDHWPLIIIPFSLSFLMVSNIKYLSFKDLGVSHLKSFNWLVATLLFFVLIAVQPQVMGFLLLILYVAGGPLSAFYITRKKINNKLNQILK